METIEGIFNKKNILDKELKLINADPDRIKQFQDDCFDLICEISRMDETALNEGLLKAGIDLICKCCLTRISVRRSGGYESITPVIISLERRNFCAGRYDEWTDKIRALKCGYIPDYFERNVPGRERLLLLQKNYLSARSDSAIQAQKESLSFSRLLGGRG